MICPMVNTPEFRKASAKFGGDDAAKRVYSLFGEYTPTIHNRAEIPQALAAQVRDNPDYYLKTYSEYLKPLLGGRSDADSILAALSARLIEAPASTPLLPPSDILYYGTASTKPSKMHSLLADLERKFNIPYSVYYDKADPRKGYYTYEGTQRNVNINMAYATDDTPFHEYLHPFVQVLKEDNPTFFDKLVQLSGATTDVDEAVTEFLGKEAIKRSNIFQQFLAWMRTAFRSLFGQNAKNITELTTLGDLFDFLRSSSIDVSRESTLFTANQAAEVYKNAIGGALKDRFTFKEDIIEALRLTSGQFTTTDDSLFYQDSTGQDVATRATAFVGDKTVGVFSTKYRNKPEEMSLYRAQMAFKDNGIDFADKITVATGEQYTLEELAAHYAKTADEERLKGKLGHAYIEYRLQDDPQLKSQALAEANKYSQQLYGHIPLDAAQVVVDLERDLQLILNIAGINASVDGTVRDVEPDRIAPEVILKSDLLVDKNGVPLATTADGVIQTKHGQVKLIDWKFGHLTSDIDTAFFMAYGGNDLNVRDSKLDRAKLELVIRAVVLKEKYPNLPFEAIKLVQIGKNGHYNTYNVDMQPYLDLLGNFYKKENPAVYEKLTQKGLLDEKNYFGVRPLTVRYIQELDKFPSFAEKVQWIENQLNSLTLGGDVEVESTEVKRQRAALTQLYQEMTALPGTNLEKNVKDIPKVVGQLKGLSDVNHPVVQTLHSELLKRKKAKDEEFEKHATTATKLLAKVLLEQEKDLKNRKLIRSILSAATVFGIVTLNPIITFAPLAANIILRRTQVKRADAFAFMWQKTSEGMYLNTNDFYYDRNDRQIPLTEAQKEYRDYIAKSMRELYHEVMSAPAFITDRGKVLTKAEIMRRPLSLPADFAPRFPKSIDEAREEQAFSTGFFGIKSRAKDFFKRNFTALIEDEFHNNDGKGGIPLKYFAHFNSRLISEGLHTMDMQQAYHAFIDSLLEKKYMDGMLSIAEGVKNTFELSKDEKGKQKYPELAKWMQSVITAQVLKTSDGMGLTSSKWKLPLPNNLKKLLGFPENKEVIIDQGKFLMLLKSGVSFAGMGYRLLGATFNTFLITITNTMNITRPLIARLMGVPPEDVRADEKSVLSAYAEYTKHLAKVMTGQGHSSKLWLMAKKFDWMPDNYDYKVGKEALFADVTSPSLFSHAYLFHNLGETYGALVHLAMMAKSVKLSDGKSKFSIWDAYEVKDGELVWTKGTRGTTEIADGVHEDLTELDFREIKNLKRAYEKLQGAYRSEERAAIEATVVGQFLFQFKKFFFTYMKNLYASPYEDLTVGKYVENKSISRPDGVPVWQWEEEIMTGRLRVAVAAVAATVKLPWGSEQYKELLGKKGTLTKAQLARRKALLELANTGMWIFFMMMILGASFDDDDKSYAKRRFTRLMQDASSGLLPVDLFDTVQKPVVAADRIAKTGKAFVQWAANEHTKSGVRKGERDLFSSIPPFAGLQQIQSMFEHTPIEQGPLFGIFPVTEGTSR